MRFWKSSGQFVAFGRPRFQGRKGQSVSHWSCGKLSLSSRYLSFWDAKCCKVGAWLTSPYNVYKLSQMSYMWLWKSCVYLTVPLTVFDWCLPRKVCRGMFVVEKKGHPQVLEICFSCPLILPDSYSVPANTKWDYFIKKYFGEKTKEY